MLQFKLAGTILIIPTVSIALLIAWKTRPHKELFYPNLAVACWITANSVWMVGEFFEVLFRMASLALFLSGIAVIGYHFVLVYKGKSRL